MFKKDLQRTYPGANRRYQGVDFLARYLGYSRAAQADPSKPFRVPSTSRGIDNYFDYSSRLEDPRAVGAEIIRVFAACPEFFDVSDDFLAFFTRASNEKRKFSKLAATTHMVATRFLLQAIATGAIDEATARAASASIAFPVPAKQQSVTIWDYQARVMLALRDSLGHDVVSKVGGSWPRFFQQMEFCKLPVEESG
jgi:hypothetical protein